MSASNCSMLVDDVMAKGKNQLFAGESPSILFKEGYRVLYANDGTQCGVLLHDKAFKFASCSISNSAPP